MSVGETEIIGTAPFNYIFNNQYTTYRLGCAVPAGLADVRHLGAIQHPISSSLLTSAAGCVLRISPPTAGSKATHRTPPRFIGHVTDQSLGPCQGFGLPGFVGRHLAVCGLQFRIHQVLASQSLDPDYSALYLAYFSRSRTGFWRASLRKGSPSSRLTWISSTVGRSESTAARRASPTSPGFSTTTPSAPMARAMAAKLGFSSMVAT